MNRMGRHIFLLLLGLQLSLGMVRGQDEAFAVAKLHWFKTQTAHFSIFSCGDQQQVYATILRLEQYREAYSELAGPQAVAAPPVTVFAFADHATMSPFLPLYNGQPANLSGFFKRGADENMIVFSLSSANASMSVIFHEYAHMLFRRDDNVWPVWLSEGMAEMYSTFDSTGRGVQIGKPIEHHLRTLAGDSFMPLHKLLNVNHDSPEYNESSMQGVFYAESWLLTHYLMNGDNLILKQRFRKFTTLLRQGKPSEEALESALMIPTASLEAALKAYLKRGDFEPLGYVLNRDVYSAQSFSSLPAGIVETYYRLGDELLRIDRLDTATSFFQQAMKLSPASPLPYEGMGLVAAARDNPQEAAKQLKLALAHGAGNYLAHYVYAKQRLKMEGDSQGRFKRLDNSLAEDLTTEAQRAIGVMPNFGPAHELLGFVEFLQGGDLAGAQQQLELAIQLEPENQSYLLVLAQIQAASHDLTSAHRTLESLLLPYIDPELRGSAEKILNEIDRESLLKSTHH